MNQYNTLADVFSGDQKQAILRVVERIQQNNNPVAHAFLDELSQISSNPKRSDLFTEVAERYICGGEIASVSSDLVRVVNVGVFLFYYSGGLIPREVEQPVIQTMLDKIQTILTHSGTNLAVALDYVLKLRAYHGRLRGKGRPLWLTDVDSVIDCNSYQDYIDRLSLNGVQPPLFCFIISRQQIQKCPNVRQGQPGFDPDDLMAIHLPTVIDGMYYDTFIEGGKTAGGASEDVSKLDNAEAIKKMEIVQ